MTDEPRQSEPEPSTQPEPTRSDPARSEPGAWQATVRGSRPVRLVRETWARRIAKAQAIRTRTYRDRGLGWRVLVPAMFGVAGVLFVASAVSSDGTDLRAGRYGDLASVVGQATEEVDELRAERNALEAEVERLTGQLTDTGVTAAQGQAEEFEVPSGMSEMTGPGLTVELDDAPRDKIADSGINPNYLIVHQQDIQAVVNAMWAGGAEAMTIQGQRVVSTTGIKCVGSTVVLHGVPYAPPYVITAIGDPASMLTSINESPYIEIYLGYVEDPRYELGWDVLPHDEVTLPPYQGPLDLDYARPAGEVGREQDSDV